MTPTPPANALVRSAKLSKKSPRMAGFRAPPTIRRRVRMRRARHGPVSNWAAYRPTFRAFRAYACHPSGLRC